MSGAARSEAILGALDGANGAGFESPIGEDAVSTLQQFLNCLAPCASIRVYPCKQLR
jgi:hypothetical protein